MLATLKPSLVVLVCGENDLYGASAKKTFKRVKKVIKAIHKTGSRVIMVGTKPEPSTVNLHGSYRMYDKLIQRYAKKMATKSPNAPAPLVFIDSYKGFQHLGNPNSLYDDDKLHLSAEGYSLWDSWVQSVLEEEAPSNCIIWRNGNCIM